MTEPGHAQIAEKEPDSFRLTIAEIQKRGSVNAATKMAT